MTAAGYRLYDGEAVRRLRFIKHAQRCGFTLADIHELLALRHAGDACCKDVKSLALEKKAHLARRIEALQAMSRALDELILPCPGGRAATDECPILAALESSFAEADR